jgi:3D (Asp-Asp-Asp) domain-containing protein
MRHPGTSALPRALAALLLVSGSIVAGASCAATPVEPEDEGQEVDGQEPEDRGDAVSGGTVAQAASGSCSTTSVKGLSLQIIEEGKCIEPDAFVEVPQLSNVSFGSAVFPYLEKPARDALVKAIQASPSKSISFNSMLRTVAQQYLLYRWSQTASCGIGLAAKPGNSNHETGLAFDTSDHVAWKSALTSAGFKWFGSSDKPHFDYVGAGAVSYKGVDVEAFQRLWNRNNPNDIIDEDGAWGPATEARMKKAPASGFAIGAQCGDAPEGPPAPGPAGASIGTFDLTYYWVANEADYTGTKSNPIYSPACGKLADVSASFKSALTLEGTGKLSDGRVLNYDGSCDCPSSPCFIVASSQAPWGYGVQSIPLVPFRSLAVDTGEITIGQKLFIPELAGKTMPGSAPEGGFVHDGCVVAHDIGGAIDGKHIDFFAGKKSYYSALDALLGASTVTVQQGGQACP